MDADFAVNIFAKTRRQNVIKNVLDFHFNI